MQDKQAKAKEKLGYNLPRKVEKRRKERTE